ncbi:MAG TPA: PP2C family protein-serine/threonine phosphatase [Thermoanaerobaculia bacterium]|nr:PP2C family protein-serine/threonine phosphatase [Thermoanaerobaculia bacterium]
MAQLNDWLELTGTTIRTVGSRGVSGLYEREWPAARRKLLEEHRNAIEQEPKRWKRWIRTASALMFGLTKKLAPERRLLFLVSAVVAGLSFVYLGGLIAGMTDGLETLTSLFVAFAILVFLLAMELIDKIRFRDELELARDLQASLLPTKPPQPEGFEIVAFNRIANTVGGDLYDFVPLADGRTAILFGDASGHGMAAGLVMAVAQAAFRTQLDLTADPDAVFATLNRLLCRTGGPRSFFTACYFLISPDGSYRSIVAGHPPILHFDGSGRLRSRIGHGSYPLGIKFPLSWEVDEGRLEPGDSLMFISDGIPESQNRNRESYGYERLEQRAAAHATARDAAHRILLDWEAFMGDATADDDVSIAVIRRT